MIRPDDVPSFWVEDVVAPRHALSCAIWSTHYQPCDCGAQDEVDDPRHLVIPMPGSTAARLDALDVDPVELDCDGGDAA